MGSRIYVLELYQGKYYIGKSDDYEKRMKAHFTGNGVPWTRLYRPLKLIEVSPQKTVFDEDNITKSYMMKFGIKNVRGGSYSCVALSEAQERTLQTEFDSILHHCYKCHCPGHLMRDCAKANDERCCFLKFFSF
jgi:predicted GIY-YIG superfamily endonuclease